MSITKMMLGCAVAGSLMGAMQAQAAPVFTTGTVNQLTFNAVANIAGKEPAGSQPDYNPTVAVGDIFYGVVNLQTIKANGSYSWNASNASAPYDSFTGYFAARVADVSTVSTILGTFSTYTFAPLTSAFGLFDANDVANHTLVKFYTDSTAVNGAAATPYTTSNLASDIAHATDGQFWGSFGFGDTSLANSGYWIVSDNPVASGSRGGIDFIANNSGMQWGKVGSLCKDNSVGCVFDMAFSSSFSRNSSGPWVFNVNDPASMQPVPLPAAAWLFGSGLAGLAAAARRRKC